MPAYGPTDQVGQRGTQNVIAAGAVTAVGASAVVGQWPRGYGGALCVNLGHGGGCGMSDGGGGAGPPGGGTVMVVGGPTGMVIPGATSTVG